MSCFLLSINSSPKGPPMKIIEVPAAAFVVVFTLATFVATQDEPARYSVIQNVNIFDGVNNKPAHEPVRPRGFWLDSRGFGGGLCGVSAEQWITGPSGFAIATPS